jgi:hypothetical protein
MKLDTRELIVTGSIRNMLIHATASLVWLEDPKTLSQRGRFVFWQYEYSVSTPILALPPSVQLYLAEFRTLYHKKKKVGLCIEKTPR